MKKICVDACLVAKWLVAEDDSEAALQLLELWTNERVQFVAPSILDYEIGTILRQKLQRNKIEQKDLYPIIEFYEKLGIVLYHISQTVFKAMAIADTLSQPTIYDIGYLLVAQQQNASFYTADKRFVKAAKPFFDRVHYFLDSSL